MGFAKWNALPAVNKLIMLYSLGPTDTQDFFSSSKRSADNTMVASVSISS